nr:LysR family transcriptional regulator [uncultured Acetatifactor sp.]
MDIDFEYFKIFYYVAKYGNITKAAAALGNSQPNVTRVMKLLEAQLGCRLFLREARGVSLTEEGDLLYSHVEIAYRHLWSAQTELRGRDSLRSGTVEIGATETALHLFLLDALQDFRRRHPAVRIKIHNHTTPEIIKRLTDGKLDFAVVTTPYAMPHSVRSEKIFDFTEMLAGGPEYRSLSRTTSTLGGLQSCPWIGLGRGTATYDSYRDFFAAQGLDMELDMEVATSDLMLPLLLGNLGIGFVPEQTALPLIKDKRLVQIPLDCALPRRAIEIVSGSGHGMGLAADAFCRYLRDRRSPESSHGKEPLVPNGP